MIYQARRFPVKRAASTALAAMLALSLTPCAAFGVGGEDRAAMDLSEKAPSDQAAGTGCADWIDFAAERAARDDRLSYQGEAELLASYNLVSLSDEFKYHLQFESGHNYDQGWSDGYHALGYYQFDVRHSLQDFLIYCYGYDAKTFSMFAFAADPSLDLVEETIYDWDAGALTEIGQKVEDAWHAAYAAQPTLFALLQDTFAYETYYLPVERDLASQGIDISERRDCVKAMCWGMSSLFGTSGCHRFLGGYVYERIDETDSYGYVYYEGAGLSNDMSDAEFVVAAGSYVVDHVAEVYPLQPQYHQGWQNRYRNEIAVCLSYIPDVVAGSWYDGCVDYVEREGIMSGYAGGYQAGRFGPEDRLTRAQAATIIYRCANPESTATSDPSSYIVSTSFDDTPDYPVYYAAAVEWCYRAGIVTGHKDAAGNETGRFGPDDPITREQLATMLFRYADWAGCDTVASNDDLLGAMPDADAVSDYALDALAWCVDRGVVGGSIENGVAFLRPTDVARRAQMAKMITVLMRDVM